VRFLPFPVRAYDSRTATAGALHTGDGDTAYSFSTGLSNTGTISLAASATTHVVIDITG
jgi:hypothetical protein